MPKAPGTPLYLLWALPVVSLLCAHFDYNYFYQGTVAFLAMSAALWLYIGVSRPWVRLTVGLLSVPLLMWCCGSVALLYALCAVVWEAAAGNRRRYFSPVLVIEAVVLALGTVRFSFLGDLGQILTPKLYYTPGLSPGAEVWFAWASLPLAIILSRLCRRFTATSRKREILLTATQSVLVAGVAIAAAGIYDNRESYRAKELDYYSRIGNWDAIIEHSEITSDNYYQLILLNMALSQNGLLAEDMFRYGQNGVNGLFPPWNSTFMSAVVRSDFLFCVGDIAVAQEMAFEGYVSTTGYGSPRLLQRLVQTNLIFGAWPVAEKYLDVLSRTLAYRDWAERHRRFLYNDEAVEADPLLGEKRRSLPAENRFSISLVDDLKAIARRNPSNKTAIECYGAMILLAKDMNTFRTMLDEDYGTERLPSLPRSFQEAVISLYESYPAVWDLYGVSSEVKANFAGFRSKLLENRSKENLAEIMRVSHGDTYWFYLMFK